MPNAVAVQQLRGILEAHGMRSAIIFLNGLTEHRYTSVFLFDGPYGRHVYYYDRENPEQEKAPDILVQMSYCIYVRNSAKPFAVGDSLADDRVDAAHPKKEAIRSYCGVPLMDALGNVLGSACHYDSQPKPIAPADVEMLELFSRMVPRNLYRS